MDRDKNVFIKCNNSTCCKEFRSKDFEQFLLKSSMKLRAATPSNNKLGQNKTFLKETINENPQFGDYRGQPTHQLKNNLELVIVQLTNFHLQQKNNAFTVYSIITKIYSICQYENCDHQFGRVSALIQHKKMQSTLMLMMQDY